MKRDWNEIREFFSDIVKTAKVRKRLLAIVVVFVVLQLYFVRELIAAELLFGLGFAVLFFLAVVFYIVGAIGERAIDATKVGAHAVAGSAHRGYVKASPVLEVAAHRGVIVAEVAAKKSVVLAGTGAKVLARSARRGYQKLEDISKKPFRHPRSESAR